MIRRAWKSCRAAFPLLGSSRPSKHAANRSNVTSRVCLTPKGVESIRIESGKHFCHRQANPKCDSPAQRLAGFRNTLLLFDEAEDLFVGRSMAFDEPLSNSRVFIHRLPERMAVPVIWTANDIGFLGPTVIRRMTMCLELKVPKCGDTGAS